MGLAKTVIERAMATLIADREQWREQLMYDMVKLAANDYIDVAHINDLVLLGQVDEARETFWAMDTIVRDLVVMCESEEEYVAMEALLGIAIRRSELPSSTLSGAKTA